MPEPAHIPVLIREVLEVLSPEPGQTYIDATAGLGGHALEIGRILGPGGTVILNDVDPANLERAQARLAGELGGACPRVVRLCGNFANLPHRLGEQGVVGDMLLADLGFSSNQMGDPSRGLSFMQEGPLDMRLDPALPTSAADLVATLPEDELSRILWEFGEERQARRIARKLAEARRAGPITTTSSLAQIVRDAIARAGGSGEGIDPATRTFQALRIAVNDELGVLDSLLASIGREARRRTGEGGWLRDGARVAIISFHSLEDRAVKRSLGELCRDGLACEIGPRLRRPDESEVQSNRRARSARLRAIRLGAIGR